MSSKYVRNERRRRQDRRLTRLQGRVAVASALSFAALFGLAAQHSVGASKHRSTTFTGRTAAAASPGRFFDEKADGFAFGDTGGAGSPQPAEQQPSPAVTQSPPVAQTSVS